MTKEHGQRGDGGDDRIASRHMRFVGATIYCPAKPGRLKLADEHRYRDGYICPHCEAIVPPANV